MKKLVLGTLSLTLLLAACGNNEEDTELDPADGTDEATEEVQESGGPRVLTDGLGNEVEIPEDPEAVLASYLEDYLTALDITPVAQWSINDGEGVQSYLQDDLADVQTIPYDLPYESVMSVEPDLILIRDQIEQDMVDQYNLIAPTYVLNASPTSWRETMREIGTVLDREDEAASVIESYDARAEETASLVQETAEGESAAAIWMIDTSLFVVHPERSSGSVLYGDAGFDIPDVVDQLSDDADWSAVSLEELAEMDVDHLFLISDAESELMEDRLWQNIPAVENDNVYTFDSQSAWLYYGPIANEQVLEHIDSSLQQ
ncbi:iron-hydroxamate ABC transporter substrate-binding protein [Alkalibacterium sp. s-m-22]|uniref:Iron-hydroxamate ABC transporter substrate-binding protein n=1 Tax=Alkalibacterium indicireducens TaxID=398758 RepID=A0ABN1AU66_9LACT